MSSSYNPDLLNRIPLSARSLLDAGCGSGGLGAAYRRLNPRARLLGIEEDLAAAEQAALVLDEVVAADIEQDPMPFSVADGIDCIVYGDVLEHLRDPWRLLRLHRDALSPRGTIVICVPNVEHWSFAARLLRGDWDYEPSGLLDRGHLRWFTLETMKKAIGEAGLHVCDVQPRVFDAEAASEFVRVLAPGLRALGIDPSQYGQRSSPLQYVWRVQSAPRTLMTVAGSMLKPVGGVSDLRVVYPMRALATEPSVLAQIVRAEEPRVRFADGPRIFVLHRPILRGEEGQRIIRGLLDREFIIVTEFDDDPAIFEGMDADDQLAFTGVHAVQTTTEPLAMALRARNPEVAVFPNAVPMLPEVANFRGEELTLFFGALNREADWQLLMPILNEVAARAGPLLRFQVVHDRPFFEALSSPFKSFMPLCDHATYMSLLGRSELSLMPLADTPFNRKKSDLKFIEAGACRVAALASHVVYAGSLKHGQTGFLFDSPAALREILLSLLFRPGEARRVADAARDYVARERMLAYQVEPRLSWYRSLWERRAELGTALRSRVPGLF